MSKLKAAFLVAPFLIASCANDTSRPAISAQESAQAQILTSQDCLTFIWKRLLPLMAKSNSYISIEDMEQVTGIKMQYVTKVSPAETIGVYQQSVNPSAQGTFSSHLSLNVEMYEDNLPPDEIFSTWRAAQWQPGSMSVVDLSCSSTLSVKQARDDLTALGLQPAGTLHKGIQRAEVFVNDWNEQVYLYYTIPLIVTPPVSSIRVVGEKILKKPPIKLPE